MATTKLLSVEVIDEEPRGSNPVHVSTIRDADYSDGIRVQIRQDEDRVYMSADHARAVHEALGDLLATLAEGAGRHGG